MEKSYRNNTQFLEEYKKELREKYIDYMFGDETPATDIIASYRTRIVQLDFIIKNLPKD